MKKRIVSLVCLALAACLLLSGMCLLLVGLGAAGFAASVTAQYFAAKAAAGFAKDVRHALYAHIQSLSFTQLDELGAATMMTRMSSRSQSFPFCSASAAAYFWMTMVRGSDIV